MLQGIFPQKIHPGHLQLRMIQGYSYCYRHMRYRQHSETLFWPNSSWFQYPIKLLFSSLILLLFSFAILFPVPDHAPILAFSVRFIEVILPAILFHAEVGCSQMIADSFYTQKIVSITCFSLNIFSSHCYSSHGINSISNGPSFFFLIRSSHCSISPRGLMGQTT